MSDQLRPWEPDFLVCGDFAYKPFSKFPHCPKCNYSVVPKAKRIERKHYTGHYLICERCSYQTESKSSWKQAYDQWSITATLTDKELGEAVEDFKQEKVKHLITIITMARLNLCLCPHILGTGDEPCGVCQLLPVDTLNLTTWKEKKSE